MMCRELTSRSGSQLIRLTAKQLRQEPVSPLLITERFRLRRDVPLFRIDQRKPVRGLLFLAKLAVCHGQEQPVPGLTSIPLVTNRLVELLYGFFRLTGPEQGCAKSDVGIIILAPALSKPLGDR